MPNHDQAQQRREDLRLLLESSDPLKLIVAGPGTGKTFSFKQLLGQITGEKLVLTFINNLVTDLRKRLGNLAEVKTLHRFSRGHMHRNVPSGLTQDFEYEPSFKELLGADATIVLERIVKPKAIDDAFHLMDHESELLTSALQFGDYYDAVGHTDAVYRMMRHLEEHQGAIPSFAQIVVDEFQDFSPLEARFVELLAGHSPTLIVGDDDQALYDWKKASPEYIRDLARGQEYRRFELRFCSRCTRVMVDAVTTVAREAQRAGLLQNRVDKQFLSYEPDKAEDSDNYPSIIHAHCTVQNARSPLMARYIEREIETIPQADLDDAVEDDYPAVLITGPKQFVSPIFKYLSERFANIEYLQAEQGTQLDLIAGYLRLLAKPRSRLGWRIVLHVDPFDGCHNLIRRALTEEEELADLIPQSYKAHHLHGVELLRKVRDEAPLTDEEIGELEGRLGENLPAIQTRLGITTDDEEGEHPEGETDPQEEQENTEPRIIVTNLLNAKGLQAGHVFVVGVNNRHFPRSNARVTETEACQLIVALTRGTKRCHVVSCSSFGGQRQTESIFVRWLTPHLVRIDLSASDFR